VGDFVNLIQLDRWVDAFEVASSLWLALFMVLLVWAYRGLKPPAGHRSGLWLCALFLGSLVVRAVLANHGPGDFKMTQQWVFYGDGHTSDYGTAPNALLKMLFIFLPGDDSTIVLVSLIFGSLAPILLVLFLKEIEAGSRVAWLAGIVLAAQPLAVRFAGAENRTMYVLFLEVVAFLSLARYGRRGDRSAMFAFLAAGLLVFDSRPEAIRLVPESFLLVIVFRSQLKRVGMQLGAVSALAFVAATPYLRYGDDGHISGILEEFRNYFDSEFNVWLDTYYTAPAMISLFFLGVVFGIARKRRLVVWALACLAISAVTASEGGASGFGNIASARYQVNSLIFFSSVVAMGAVLLDTLSRRLNVPFRRAALSVLGGLIAFDSAQAVLRITEPCTIDGEYAFVRETVRALPSDAEIYQPPLMHADAHLCRLEFLSLMLGHPDQRWLIWPPVEELSDRPRYYLHSVACSLITNADTQEHQQRLRANREVCWQIQARYASLVVEEEWLPTRVFGDDAYDTDEVLVGLYRMPPDEIFELPGPSRPEIQPRPPAE
jgi:hypothetical protein